MIIARAVTLMLSSQSHLDIVGRQGIRNTSRSRRARDQESSLIGAFFFSASNMSCSRNSRGVLEPYVKHSKQDLCSWKGFDTQEEVLAYWRFKCLTTHVHDHPQEYDGGENPFQEGWVHPAERASTRVNTNWIPGAPPTSPPPSPSKQHPSPVKRETQPFAFASPSKSQSTGRPSGSQQGQPDVPRHFVVRRSDGAAYMFDDQYVPIHHWKALTDAPSFQGQSGRCVYGRSSEGYLGGDVHFAFVGRGEEIFFQWGPWFIICLSMLL